MTIAYVNTLLKGANKQLTQRNFEQALKLANTALHIAKGKSYLEQTQQILITIGHILHKKGIYQHKEDCFDEAIVHFKQAKTIHSTNYKRQLELLVDIASVHIDKKNYEKAVEILDNTLRICENENYTTGEIKTLNALSYLGIAQKKFSEALDFGEMALALLTPNTTRKLVIECYQNLLQLYVKVGKFVELHKIAEKLIKISERVQDLEGEARGYSSLAIVHLLKAAYKEAFEYLTKSNEKAAAIGYDRILMSNHANLGALFSDLGNFEDAIKQLERVLTNYGHLITDFNCCAIHFNISGAYFMLKDKEKSLEHAFKALEITEKYNFIVFRCRIYFQISNIFIQSDEYEKGLEYIQKAQQSYHKHQDLGGSDANLVNFATIYYHQKDYKTALKYALEGIHKATASKNLKTERRGYHQLAKIYKALNQKDEAYDALEKYSELNETLMRELRKRQLIALEIQYNIKEQKQEIALLKQEMKLKELELEHQKTIESQNAKLKMNNEELKQFTYAISHDLKEPLRMIGSFSRLWMKRHRRQADERDKEYFRYISGGVTRMTNMLNGLLDYATIGTNSRKQVAVDLNELLLAVKETLYVKIQENNATLHIEELPTVTTHKLLLFQLFQNLVSNAIKFRKKEVDPIVRVAAQTKEDRYIFSVADNGIGISKKHQDTIFIIFKRLHSKEEYEGTGIGLSLCKKIVQQLGGEIWLTSELGKGTTFFFTLPR